MSEIVERLRQGIDPLDIPEAERAMDAGADEIVRLRALVRTCPLCSELEEQITTPPPGSAAAEKG